MCKSHSDVCWTRSDVYWTHSAVCSTHPDAPCSGKSRCKLIPLRSAGSLVLIGAEMVLVLTEVGEYLTVRRAQRDTAAVTHVAGASPLSIPFSRFSLSPISTFKPVRARFWPEFTTCNLRSDRLGPAHARAVAQSLYSSAKRFSGSLIHPCAQARQQRRGRRC